MAEEISLEPTAQQSDLPNIRQITFDDIKEALAKGLADFNAMPTHYFFVIWIYPLVILLTIRAFDGGLVLPLLFPIVAGYTILGPFVATGMYELSRRRELGLDTSRRHLVDCFKRQFFGRIARLGLMVMLVYAGWVVAAWGLYEISFGRTPPLDFWVFVDQVFSTSAGVQLIVVGCLVGLVFAAAAFTLSVVSFPMLIDRNGRARDAIKTSINAVLANPGPMAVWGVIVAVSLVLATIPLLLGLVVVLPVLGHATWHLYRRVVE